MSEDSCADMQAEVYKCVVCGKDLTNSHLKLRINHLKGCAKKHQKTAKDIESLAPKTDKSSKTKKKQNKAPLANKPVTSKFFTETVTQEDFLATIAKHKNKRAAGSAKKVIQIRSLN